MTFHTLDRAQLVDCGFQKKIHKQFVNIRQLCTMKELHNMPKIWSNNENRSMAIFLASIQEENLSLSHLEHLAKCTSVVDKYGKGGRENGTKS